MSKRFSDLTKIPAEPAARMLSRTHIKLETSVDAPASASVEIVLDELNEKAAWIDIMKLLAAALPPREAVWWGCIAARDLLGDEEPTLCLKAAEAWVFDPSADNRNAVKVSLDNVYVDDDTDLVATAAIYAPGNMGEGDLAEYPAPVSAVSACVFGINMKSLKVAEDAGDQLQVLIDRAVDIARGGNGQIEKNALGDK
jgi:hypothetical protein